MRLLQIDAFTSEKLLPPSREARFQTRSGLLTASRNGDLIELNFPATLEKKVDAPAGLLESLGTTAKYVGLNKFDYLVELELEEAVRALKPDYAGLRKLGVRGVIVTSRASNGHYDFVSRWASRLGKSELTAYQASSRGGVLRVRIDGDRVHLGGRAVTVLRGELTV